MRSTLKKVSQERMVGGWQCQHCYLSAMNGWAGTEYPKEEDAPTCCYGERMQYYRIPNADFLSHG